MFREALYKTVAMKSIGAATIIIAGVVVDEKTLVPIGSVMACTIVFGRAIWWIGRKLQSLEDRQEHLSKQLDQITATAMSAAAATAAATAAALHKSIQEK